MAVFAALGRRRRRPPRRTPPEWQPTTARCGRTLPPRPRRLALQRPAPLSGRCRPGTVHQLSRSRRPPDRGPRAAADRPDRPTDLLELVRAPDAAADRPDRGRRAERRPGRRGAGSARRTPRPTWSTRSTSSALVELRGLIRPAEDLALFRAEMAAWPGRGALQRLAGAPRATGCAANDALPPRHPRPARQRRAAAVARAARTPARCRGGRAAGPTTATSRSCSS